MKKLSALLFAVTALCMCVTSIPVTEWNSSESVQLCAYAASEIKSGTFGDGLEWSLDEDYTLTISGNGRMPVGHAGLYATAVHVNRGKIKKIIIEDGVQNIGEGTFQTFTGLTSVSIPDSVTDIGDNAFLGCSALTELDLPDTLVNVGMNAFDKTPWLEEKQTENPLVIEKHILIDGKAASGDIVIPDGVTVIAAGAFNGCSELNSVTIPDSVAHIGYHAFRNTPWLDALQKENPLVIVGNILLNGEKAKGDVIIPDNVTCIAEGAFEGCSGMTSVSIPDGVTEIGYAAFYKCSSLTSVVLPASLNTISISSFMQCNKLTSVIMPEHLQSIEEWAFYQCSALTSVDIPADVTFVGEDAFRSCSNLTDFHIDENNPVYSSQDGVWFNQDKTVLLHYPPSHPRTEYTIPDSVITIGEYAFQYADHLTTVSIPNSVTSIGDWAFSTCSGLTSIDIPGSVTTIGEAAFSTCRALTSVQFGNGVETIGRIAFISCDGLTSLVIPASVTSIVDTAFEGCNSLISVDVDQNNPAYTSQDGILFNKDQSELILYPASSSRTEYTVPDSVKTIADHAFAHSPLISVTIPANVSSIGMSAFTYNADLKEISILNPACVIYDNISVISTGYDSDMQKMYFSGTIYGYPDSTAQAYAEKYERKFVSLDGEPDTTEPQKLLKGDANADGSVNILDVITINRVVLGKEVLPEAQLKAIDFNGNGQADAEESLMILKYLVNIITSFD